MLGRQLNYFPITIYVLLNILINYKCSAFECYDCDHCPNVDSFTPKKDGCVACLIGGANVEVSRACVGMGSGAPENFPTLNWKKCYGPLCNKMNSTLVIHDPISCYVCRDCGHTNERIETVCGACATRNASGIISKYCLKSCEEVTVTRGSSCCTTDLCNGEMKLNIRIGLMIFLLIFTHFSTKAL
ncbi:unnamed protein product [Trichobilharzia szidati]|nr:unnamed protein product [Trichobilharzia szidati]